MTLEIIFWIAVFLIFHTYVFYPVILRILSLSRHNNRDIYQPGEDLPFVSVIISAYNEEAYIGEKIRSIFKGSYPAGKFEVLVGSDHSTDRTCELVKSLTEEYPSLHLFDFHERRGKGNVVNDLVKSARGNILILTDANVLFDADTIFHLVKHFKNKSIGLVDTNMINRGMRKEGISYQERAYISREVKIKNMEGKLWGAMMGPFGGCYAILKEDYSMVPSNYLVDDFYINMKIFEKRKLAINDTEAKVYEDLPDNLRVEFRRKIRIGTGNFQNLRAFWKLLFTQRYGFAFWSHKVIRWFGPFIMIITMVVNIFLALNNELYLLILVVQVLAYLLPLLDFILKKMNIHLKPLRLITHFYSMNAALFIGFFKSLGPVRSGVWERTHRK
jgi:cellulose synthase/poly-beta-1,6-N-acetylglucosamine synthase-like glycosyltransferase